jgi:hypothetical protein
MNPLYYGDSELSSIHTARTGAGDYEITATAIRDLLNLSTAPSS